MSIPSEPNTLITEYRNLILHLVALREKVTGLANAVAQMNVTMTVEWPREQQGYAGVGEDVRRWNQGTVPKIASSILKECRYGNCPILADALEEAGFTEPRVLHWLRVVAPALASSPLKRDRIVAPGGVTQSILYDCVGDERNRGWCSPIPAEADYWRTMRDYYGYKV
jgi:hypothetical protein